MIQLRIVPFALLLLVCAACSETAETDASDDRARPAASDTETVETPEPVAPTLTREEAEARRLEDAVARDEAARKLLESFEARAYDPRRDSGLERLVGRMSAAAGDELHEFTIDVRVDPEGELVLDVERVDATRAPPRVLSTLVTDAARLAAAGCVPVVVTRRPPIRYHLIQGQDGGWIVRAPAHLGNVHTSYRFDAEQTVVLVGHVGSQGKQVFHHDYQHYKGRYLLERTREEGREIVTRYDYEEQAGVLLPVRVTRDEADDSAVVTCTWDEVVATPPPR